MIRKLVHYEVRKEDLPLVLDAVRAFVDEVARKEGGTARYQAYQHKDAPTRFTHFMEFRTPAAEKYHQTTPWVKRFTETLLPRCTKEPVFSEIEVVEKG